MEIAQGLEVFDPRWAPPTRPTQILKNEGPPRSNTTYFFRFSFDTAKPSPRFKPSPPIENT